MKKYILPVFILLALITFPSFALAEEHCDPEGDEYLCNLGSTSSSTCSSTIKDVGDLLCKLSEILNSIIPVLVALGVVYFVWGVVNYMIADSEEVKKKGKDSIVYGVIGLAVIVSLWGLVNIVQRTFDLDSSTAPSLAPITGTTGATCTSLAGSPKLQDLLCYLTGIINNSIIPLLFAVATVFFVLGAVKFFFIDVNEEAKRSQGKQFMIWGIVALAVMVSIWGLVAILGRTFNIETSILPQVKPPS